MPLDIIINFNLSCMRARFSIHTPKLPIIYRNKFMSLIKEALKQSDRAYKEWLYPDKESERSKVAKPFCFSVTLPKAKEVKREPIKIDEAFVVEDLVFNFEENSYISLIVSSFDHEFVVNLYNGVIAKRVFDFPDGFILTFRNAILLKEKRLEKDFALLKTLSPILIETNEGKPLLPINDLEAFNREFNAIHDRILRDIRGYGLRESLRFSPLEIEKQVVKHTLRGFREKTGKPYMTLTCFEGCFELRGNPEDLQALYQIGIGLRTGQGFGMVDVVSM